MGNRLSKPMWVLLIVIYTMIALGAIMWLDADARPAPQPRIERQLIHPSTFILPPWLHRLILNRAGAT